jgi:chromosomal replication initiation ATPase DnaA
LKQKASISNSANVPSALNVTAAMSDGEEFRTAINLQCLTNSNPSIELRSDSGDIVPSINIEHIIHEWTLNPEQSQAFRIITEHSLHPQPELLRMFLSGPAGTGKTRVINAVKDFFERRTQTR